VSLVVFNGVDTTTLDCPHCGGTRRVVPSCSYTSGDVELFEELSETVSRALSPVDAQRLAVEVSRALWSGSPAELFNALAVRWPSLVPLVVVTGKNRPGQHRVLLMLKSIFEALALTRRSGMMEAVRDPSDADASGSRRASGA
jgi:hypothetical protein